MSGFSQEQLILEMVQNVCISRSVCSASGFSVGSHVGVRRPRRGQEACPVELFSGDQGLEETGCCELTPQLIFGPCSSPLCRF